MMRRLTVFFLVLSLQGAASVFNGPVTGQFLLQCNASEENRIENYDVVSGKQFISQQATIDSVNSRLRWVYDHYGIECYFVLMEYFDVMVEGNAEGRMGPDSLFGGGKFYSEYSLIDSMKQFHNRTGSWMKLAIANALQRPVILVNIARYHTLYSGISGVNYYLSLHYAHRGNYTLPPGFNAMYEDLLQRCKQHNLSGAHLFNDNLVLSYANQVRNAAFIADLKGRILNTYTVSGLKNILKHFSPGDVDYKRLTLAERAHCLSLFVGESMMGGIGNTPGEEEFALWILQHCPAADVPGLIALLSAPSVLNSDPNYQGDQGDQRALLERLVAGIDGDNYRRLMLHCNSLLRKTPAYESQLVQLFSESQLDKKCFVWNDDWTQTPVVGHVKYLASFSERKIRVNIKRVEAVEWSTSSSGNVPVSSIIYADEPVREFGFFEPVLFVSDCDLPAFMEAGAEKGMPLVVPAIFLKYAHDKDWNDQFLTASAIGADVVTLAAAPVAMVKALTWTRRAWVAFEAATALGNLTINTLGNDLPTEFHDVVQQSNYLMLAVGGKNLLKGGYASLSYALAGTKEFTTRISKELALNLARSLNAESAPGLTRLQRLEQLAPTSLSAKAITRFYQKLKQLYKDSFKRDLEADLLPQTPPYFPSWVSEIKTVEDYLNKIPIQKRQDIIRTFKPGTMSLSYSTEEMILIRHIGENGYDKSYWFAVSELSPSQARKIFALPNNNPGTYISVSRIRLGVPFIDGMAADMTNLPDFGPYAVGGGRQLFFLREFWENDELIRVIESKRPNLIQ